MHRSRPATLLAVPLVLSILTACGARPAAAPTPGRHVSTSGKDAGDCRAAPCKTIGYAVAKAAAGDTISVDSGTYHESVKVTKRLAIVGHGATLDAAWKTSPLNGFLIEGDSAAGSRVEGFTIRNAALEAIFVHRTSGVVIANNTVIDNDGYGKGSPLCSQQPADCGEAIHLQAVTGSVVRGNVIRHDMGGILLTDEDGPTHDNLITANTLADNPTDCGITLASHWVDTVSGKAVTPERGGVYKNTVSHNSVTGSGGAGIGIFAAARGGAAWGNVIEGNTSSENGLAGIAIHSHTAAQNLDGNVLKDNILSGNLADTMNPADTAAATAGISIASTVVPIRNTVVTGNRISGERFGIVAIGLDKATDLTHNTIEKAVVQVASKN